MIQSLFHGFCLIFVIIGIFSVLSCLYTVLLCKKSCKGVYTVIYCDEDEALLADKVYTACCLSKYMAYGSRNVYVADNGISPYTKRHCREIISGIGRVHFISEDELTHLNEIYKNND
ncbi:MAG: hypothetical protein IJW86_09050 [Clostridia bacterium]|nr:hypothetical protein [Clostridia bacterium]